LLRDVLATGPQQLESIVRDYTTRLLNRQGGQQFTDEEKQRLRDSIETAIAPADLLGRAHATNIAGAVSVSPDKTYSDAEPLKTFADPIPPLSTRRALDYFKSLVPKLGLDPERYALSLERRAFTLAAATQQTIVEKVQEALAKRLGFDWYTNPTPQDVDDRTGAQVVQDVLDEVGVTPRSSSYSEMVYRTNVIDAYHTGFDRVMDSKEMQEDFPVWEYIGIRDGRQGEDHEPKFGKFYPSSATFSAVRGPRVFSCRCNRRMIPAARWRVMESQGHRLETSW
jgi:hypothetical protein